MPCPALTLAVGKGALRVRRLVLEPSQHAVQAVVCEARRRSKQDGSWASRGADAKGWLPRDPVPARHMCAPLPCKDAAVTVELAQNPQQPPELTPAEMSNNLLCSSSQQHDVHTAGRFLQLTAQFVQEVLDVGPRQALERVEAQARVLHHHCG